MSLDNLQSGLIVSPSTSGILLEKATGNHSSTIPEKTTMAATKGAATAVAMGRIRLDGTRKQEKTYGIPRKV